MRTINLIFILLFTALTGIYAETGTKIKTGIPALIKSPRSGADTANINRMVRSGLLCLSKKGGDLKMAEVFIDSAVSYCEKRNIGITGSLRLLRAQYYFISGDYSNSEEEAKQAYAKALEEKNYKVQANAMLFLAKYYLMTGLYQSSMKFLDAAIDLAREKGLKGTIQLAYQTKADVLDAAKDLDGVIENLELMIDASTAEKDTFSLENGLRRLGTIYASKRRDFRLCDSLLRRCIEISLASGHRYSTAYSLANLGWNYYLEKMYDSSLHIYNRSIGYGSPEFPGSFANSLGNIGTIYRDLGQYEKALDFYRKSIEDAHKANDYYNLYWVYEDMSQLYLKTGDTVNAYKSYVMFKTYSDSVMLIKSSQGLTEARIRYEADAHNKEVALLSLKLKNNRLLNIGYTVFVLLGLAISLLVIRSSKIQAKRRISDMNHKISEITQANLRQQMNPHFIFNTLNSIQYYMYQHDKLATNNYLTKFSTLMRKVLENSQHTSVPLRDELDALNLYLELECLRFQDKFDYRITLDEEIDPLLFKVPTMLIQPYVENSICHGLMAREGKGYVKIDMKLGEDQIICTIEDNGIGREAAQERKKQKGANHNSLGTQIVSSRLDLVNSLYGTSLKTVYTDLKNKNGEPEGTRVEIHIPIMT